MSLGRAKLQVIRNHASKQLNGTGDTYEKRRSLVNEANYLRRNNGKSVVVFNIEGTVRHYVEVF